MDYLLRMPPDTQVAAACGDVACESWQFGWETTVDESTDLGREQAAYIRHRSGRDFSELQSGGLTVFRFSPRQRCFAEHRTRPASWLMRNGTVRRLSGMREWVDRIGEDVTRIEEQRKRG